MVTAIVGVQPTVGLTVALVALGITTVISATFALLSLLPTVDSKGQSNPLFFGHAARLEYVSIGAAWPRCCRPAP